MKKLFTLINILLFTALCAHASKWGFIPDAVDEATAAGQEESAQPDTPTDKKYLLQHILQGKPVYYRLDASLDKDPSVYEEKIPKFINAWFRNTLKIIKSNKREAEFADIIPILERGADVRQAQLDQYANITFHFVSRDIIMEMCGEFASACIFADNFDVYIQFNASPEKQKRSAIHEMGHAFGLSDQYRLARSANSDAFFHTQIKKNSIMNGATNITCDDATGFINAIDLTRRTSNGRQWKGLCKGDKNFYQDGAIIQDGYRMNLHNYKNVLIEKYENGKRTKSKVYEFDLDNNASAFVEYVPQTIDKKDKQDRPIQATTANGEKIYYAYVYDGKYKLVVKNGKVKQFNKGYYVAQPLATAIAASFVKMPKYNRTTYFGLNGELCALGGSIYTNKSKDVDLFRGIDPNRRNEEYEKLPFAFREHIFHELDRKGNLIDEFYSGDDSQKGNIKEGFAQKIQAHKNGLSEKVQEAVTTAQQGNMPQEMDEWVKNLKNFFD